MFIKTVGLIIPPPPLRVVCLMQAKVNPLMCLSYGEHGEMHASQRAGCGTTIGRETERETERQRQRQRERGRQRERQRDRETERQREREREREREKKKDKRMGRVKAEGDVRSERNPPSERGSLSPFSPSC